MKKYLKFIEESELTNLISHVNDHHAYLNNESNNKSLNKKLKIKQLIETATKKKLNEFFKEKLIFKLFNECNWSLDKIKEETESVNINEVIIKLARNYNIKI